jgi:hypothetical protein
VPVAGLTAQYFSPFAYPLATATVSLGAGIRATVLGCGCAESVLAGVVGPVLEPGEALFEGAPVELELALELPLLQPARPSAAAHTIRLITLLPTCRTRHCYPPRLNRAVSSHEYG